jgi:hypothetical protein
VDLVRLLVVGSFALVAFTAVRVRLRDPAPSTTWLAGMFCTLAAALLVSRLLGTEREGGEVVVGIGSSALIVAFPYLLFRFAESFRPVAPARRHAVTALIAVTIAVVTVSQTLEAIVGADPARYLLVLVVALGTWTGLTGWVVWRFWTAGRDQPAVTRRRMRTMAAAAALLNVALVLAGVGTGGIVPLLAQILALASAYTFVLAFAPPSFVRAMWRQADERALWQAEGALVAADNRQAVVGAILPHVARLLGGGGALFVDHTGEETVIGLEGRRLDEIRHQVRTAPTRMDDPTLTPDAAVQVLPLGRLAVAASPYTPMFGKDDLELMGRLGALLELALHRVEESLTSKVFAAFEQGLLPRISTPEGLLVDTRYRPGQDRLRLGGDFMNVITFPDGAAGFVIGDVSGHGPAEAAFAVEIHAGWRTLARADPHSPAAWLTLLDETFFDDHPERLVTALTGRVEVERRAIALVSAGHCTPVILGPAGGARLLDVGTDPLLGIGHPDRRKVHTLTLEKGESLLLYTDGLIEQPRPDAHQHRWTETDLLAWFDDQAVPAMPDLDALLYDFGRDTFADDVAVMLLRFAS